MILLHIHACLHLWKDVFINEDTHSCMSSFMKTSVKRKERDIHACLHFSLQIFTFVDGYCSTVQGLLDWFEVDLGFTELSFMYLFTDLYRHMNHLWIFTDIWIICGSLQIFESFMDLFTWLKGCIESCVCKERHKCKCIYVYA